MIAASGFKRLGFAVLAALAVIFGALAATSYLVPADRVRAEVKAQIRAATGLDPDMRGFSAVSLFPSGRVSFSDVALGENNADAGPPLTAELLTAQLRFLPLLTGRIQIASIELVNPRIAVTIDDSGQSNWGPLVAALTSAFAPRADNSNPALPSFSEIRIVGGLLRLRDATQKLDEQMTNMEISLGWPSISRSFAATGRFLWHGEPVDGSLGIGDFIAALAGDKTGLKLRLAAAPAKLAFDGALSLRPTLKIEGTLGGDAPSLRRALVWANRPPLPGGGFGRFSFKAQTNIVGGTINLASVNVELDGNAAEGVMTFAGDERKALQATLAADNVDLTPYISTIRLLAANEREWNRVPIALDGFDEFDLDLRLSAAKVTLATARLGRTAVAANLRDGKLAVTVGESQAYGGVIKGSLSFAHSAGRAAVKSQLQFTNVDLDSSIGDLFGIRRLEGKGTFGFDVEGSGANVLAITRTLNGSATLLARQGAITGLNVEQLLRRLERRPLSGGNEFRSGRTPFDSLAVEIKIAHGIATVENVSLQGQAVRLALGGSASIPAREFDLKGNATLVSSSPDTTFDLPFVVQGPWDDPVMLPDPQILIRRSGAAAPLLEAVRDRRARDAVRSAIEKLSGGRLVEPARPAEPKKTGEPAAAPAESAKPAAD
jgi:AsmA protein